MNQLFHDPHWPRAGGWLRGEHAEPADAKIAVIGAPLALGAISPSRCDLAPNAIREALQRFSTFDVESGRDVRELGVTDRGDLQIAGFDPASSFEPISNAVCDGLNDANAVILLGGNNGITRPGVHGMRTPLTKCGVITFDAHFDLRDTGSGLNNGNPIRALLEDGLPGKNIVQIGIQSFANSAAYAKVGRDAGIVCVAMEEIMDRGLSAVVAQWLLELGSNCDSIYVDLDLDVLDRAYAPAAPGSRPGGLLPREIRSAVRQVGLHPKVRVLDLVEIDPQLDIQDVTVLAAAACLLSFASGVLGRCTQ